MTRTASLRSAAAFSVLALVLMALTVATMVASSGAGAQDPLETFSDPATFTTILKGADPALRTVLFLDTLFATAYAGIVVFAAIGFRDHCPPASWAAGLGILVVMGLDFAENLLMLGSLGLASAGEGVTGGRVTLHVFVSGLKLHLAAATLVAFTFALPARGLATFLMRWGGRIIMPTATALFVTDAFGASGYGSLGVFAGMIGGFVLLPIVAFAEAGSDSDDHADSRERLL